MSSENMVKIYSIPEGIAINEDFSVRVRPVNGEWEELYPYKVKVDMHNVREASMVQFDFTGIVELEVLKNTGTINDVVIRPLSYNIPYQQFGNKITFKIREASKLSLEVNGDHFHNLHIFAGTIEENSHGPEADNIFYVKPGIHRPKKLLKSLSESKLDDGSEADLIYFAPGLHYIEEVELSIPSGKEVYLAGGAVLVGSIVCDSVHDVKIRGRGIIYLMNFERFSSFRGFRIIFSRNICIEGITVINPPHYSIFIGQSKDISIVDFKSFSCEGWSDGIDIMSSSNIEINDVFLRNSDDCIAVYGRRWEFNGDCRNIRVKNAILWADVAHPMMMGTHGDYQNEGNVIENITFENIDVLEHHELQENYKGCMAINAGDKNIIRNITYKDIRVEEFEEGRLIDIRVVKNPDYNPEPGSLIENIFFENISYNGAGEYTSLINSFDCEHIVKDIIFDNLVINGKKIENIVSGEIFVGEYVENVVFK